MVVAVLKRCAEVAAYAPPAAALVAPGGRLHSLWAQGKALLLQKDADPSITVPRILFSQPPHRGDKCLLLGGEARLITQARTGDAQ
jgi:hypothetical protein